MKIYTKTGDTGLTSLFDGTRVKKFHPRVEAYGTIDELNSWIGVIVAGIQKSRPKADRPLDEKLKSILGTIQNDLLNIGSTLADPSTANNDLEKKLASHTKQFETYIDTMTQEMPTLTNFILPGGGEVGSFLHVARVIVRRAERRVVELAEKNSVGKEIIVYLNRLSDLFFTMSRYVNFKEKRKETIWTKRT